MTRHAAAAMLVAGRYRLERPMPSGACTTLWRAVDEVLDRPVAVKILDSPAAVPGCVSDDEALALFATFATSVGRLAHSRIASTYDAGVDDGLPYLVTEWVDGRPLVELVTEKGVLTPELAVAVGVQAAEALVHAHDRGVPHGDLDGANLLVRRDGTIKLTDFVVAAALGGRPAPADPQGIPDELCDTRALAALVYLCLTGRSVNGAEGTIPPALRHEGHLLSPLQVRAGVPRGLDAAVMRVLDPAAARGAAPITTPGGLLAALAPMRVDPPPHVDATLAVHRHGQPRAVGPPASALRAGVPLLLLTVVGVAAVATCATIREPARARSASGSTNPAGAEKPRPDAGRLRIRQARDFDPEGRPDTENPELVPLSHDGKSDTVWQTDRYDSAPLGQLKRGVGLQFDLGRSTVVRKVRVSMLDPGATVELRSSDAPGQVADTYAVVARAEGTDRTFTLAPRGGATGRYWVLWLTRLPANSDGFKAKVAEVAFYG